MKHNLKLLSIALVQVMIFSACQQNTVKSLEAPAEHSEEAPALSPDTNIIIEESESRGTVWVCKSAGAKKYHYNRNCGGLGRCKHEVAQMISTDAEAVGLTACSYKKCSE